MLLTRSPSHSKRCINGIKGAIALLLQRPYLGFQFGNERAPIRMCFSEVPLSLA